MKLIIFRVVTGYVCIRMVSIGVFTPYFAQDRLCDCSYLLRARYPIQGSFFFALVLLSGWGYSSADIEYQEFTVFSLCSERDLRNLLSPLMYPMHNYKKVF